MKIVLIPLKVRAYKTVTNRMSFIYEIGVFNQETGKLITTLQQAFTNDY